MASGVQGSRSPALLLLVPVPGPTGSVLPPPARPAQRGRGSVSVQPRSRHHPQCPHPDQPRVTVSSEVQPSERRDDSAAAGRQPGPRHVHRVLHLQRPLHHPGVPRTPPHQRE